MRALVATFSIITAATIGLLAQAPTLADACAGLIGSNGAVNLGRTTTLAAYHDGVEHYITAFEFQGGGGEFGTLIPLPDVPTKVERGGDWTLQRLQLETAPPDLEAAFADGAVRQLNAEVLLEVRIDALDITVLRGGGPDVAAWATEHGFRLSPDAPEVLDFYAQRSPIFLAAVFDGDAAAERGQLIGDGTPVHLTIPTDDPWVPLRILALGKQVDDLIQADVFLLTDDAPTLLPAPSDALALTYSEAATDLLLDDLRSDAGMGWIPDSAWLTKLEINSLAADLTYDLAVDTTGDGRPSVIDAGLELPAVPSDSSSLSALWLAAAALAVLAATFAIRARITGARGR
ncbi:MAG: DUF2330 domain-containing protein [Chloroflexi bacterium]|nr:DUF2330 domain-containing protein [Chloroflexota bacterium]MCI0886135.1 DUF2330 domain-containing protein [Chloroflexota bacterium]